MRFDLFKKKTAHASDKEDSERILNDDTPFAVKEAYRALGANFLYLPIEDKCKKIAVTSAFPGEGKTFVSINLAITLATSSEKRRVLLIDADMRKSRVLRLLSSNKYSKTSGLSEYIAGIDDVPNISGTDYPNLDVLSSGAEAANPTGLLSSSRMEALMRTCNEKYDYVIFDTPPVNVVADALVLNDHINGYIIATRADYSDVNSLGQVVDALKRIDAEVYGIVLSSVDLKKGDGYSRSYNKYGYSSYDNGGGKKSKD